MQNKNSDWRQDICQLWHFIFRGTENTTSFFSFEGILNRQYAWGTVAVIYAFLCIVNVLRIPLITYIVGLMSFYWILALVQKRCRDFGSKGTFWVIFVTLIMVLESSLYFVDVFHSELIWKYIWYASGIMYICLLIPALIPGKPDADINLRSPLLKYPLLYTAVCWVLAIVATLAVNHYAGIEVF